MTDGDLSVAIADVELPTELCDTMNTDVYSPADFMVAADTLSVDVAVIERPRFTQWGTRTLPVVDGWVACPPDLTRMAVINRFGADPAPRVAFLGEWGTWQGAFATTVSHDSHNLTVFGGNEDDMAVAANHVSRMGGGMAVSIAGTIVASLALPVAGLISLAPVNEIASEFRAIREAMDDVVTWQPPFLVFKACFGASLVCNPGPRLSDVGIVDISIDHRQSDPLGGSPT